MRVCSRRIGELTMRFVLVIFLAMGIGSFTHRAEAANAKGGYFLYAKYPCSTFVESYSKEIAARSRKPNAPPSSLFTDGYTELHYYVAGWLTAYNALTPDTYDILPNGNDGAMIWLNNFCTANPLELLETGLNQLVIEAYPNRKRE